MRKFVTLGEHLLFIFNVLIVFLLLFENRLVLPAWVQVIGRMHPMFLHFPIVIILLAIAFYFLRSSFISTVPTEISKGLLLLGALSASLTIIMGLFLSYEGGYAGSLLQWHKWMGITVGFLTSACYYYIWSRKYSIGRLRIGGGVTILCLLLAGHFGAELTHGEDFLFAPVRPAKVVKHVPLEEAKVYDDIIAPILEEKCASCHNPSKAKGNLVLTSTEGLLKGGKGGKLFGNGNAKESLLLKRIHLPEEDKKHMPPKNKPQLSASDIEILQYWIRSGADVKKKVIDFATGDTLRALLQQRVNPPGEEHYNFIAADENIVRKLNTAYRVITPVAAGSPAVAVTIYNAAAFNSKLLEELKPIQKQIVSLDLNKMPVTDNDLKIIAGFENLRRLNLNFTQVTGASLSVLSTLKSLHSLSLSSTQIGASHLNTLSGFQNLKQLYIWNTPLNEKELKELKLNLSEVVIETGFIPDHTKVLRLTTPRIENERKIFTSDFAIQIAHPVKGATIRYTLDGTEPDSVRGLIYESPVNTSSSVTTIKARAYKEGWFGSEATTSSFYKTKYTPDTIVLTTLPERKYFAKGARSLYDHESGDVHYGSSDGWLGYRENPLEIAIEFHHPTELKSVTLSTRHDLGAHIFPAQRIQVWGGSDKNHLELLSTLQPAQPQAFIPPVQSGAECTFAPRQLSYLKIIAVPIPTLPSWHSNKGQKGWFFVDEILFN
jgi:uncharacterized membrane protein